MLPSRRVALAALVALVACTKSPSPGLPPRAAPPAVLAAPSPPADADVAARIARIEHGLRRGARIAGEPGDALDDRMRAHHVNGLSIAVFDHDQVVWAKGYGLADVEAGTPVTATTLFQAGSISKPVTAMAALAEVQKGTFSLDAKINDVLTTWQLPDNDLTRATPVTLAMLLSHTGGTTVHGFPGYAAGEALPTLPQIFDGLPPANTPAIRVDLAPGTRFRYSGGGFTLVQQALVDTPRSRSPSSWRSASSGPSG